MAATNEREKIVGVPIPEEGSQEFETMNRMAKKRYP